MEPPTTLSDADLDELDDFLLSDAMPESGMDISALDGFLAAVTLNPELIMPSRWLPWVWDMEKAEEGPAFESLAQAGRITGLVLSHYNMVLQAIQGGWFEPLFYELNPVC